MSVLDGDHSSVLLVDDEVGGSGAELRSQDAVIRARKVFR